jgi:hypothetical protein
MSGTGQPVAEAGEPELSRRDRAGFLSSAKSFFLPLGAQFGPGEVRGYPIDMRVKASEPKWPPAWVTESEDLYVDVAQWALGAHERYLGGEGEEWLAAAVSAGEELLGHQHQGGRLDGAFFHRFPYPHTFPVAAPWISAMAQGEVASLMVRLHGQTGRQQFADAARRALGPIDVPQAEGGAQGLLDGQPFPEEYPTDPASFVLNGAMFSLWGYHDVGVGLDDAEALSCFRTRVDTLAANLHRWDTGFWSRYDLYPHVMKNVASSFYHSLHVAQLEAMNRLEPRPELAATRERFAGYVDSRACQVRAFAHKALFRLAVPRNRYLARRLPWIRRPPA